MALRPNPNQKWEDLKTQASRGRKPHERDAWLNLAFYLDEQYVEFTEATNGSYNLRRIPRQEGEENVPRPVVNKIMHFINQQQAIIMQNKPTVDVLPATEDVIDAGHASVSKAYLDYLVDPSNMNFDLAMSEAALWALICGNGWLKWIMNDRLKRPDVLAPNYFDVYVDPYAKTFDKARYVIHSQFMDVEQIYDVYDKEVQATRTQTQATRGDMATQLLQGMGVAPMISGAQVNELWMKPTKRHPNGLYVVWTDRETLVEPQDHPYDHKRLPFTQLASIPRPGSLYAASSIKWLRPPQMELNKYHAQRIMTRQAFASAKWWIPSEIELEKDPDDSPNQILRGTGPQGMEPKILQPAVFASGDEGDWIKGEMMDVVGQHEVSQGQVPGRVEAAKAIELLRESDTSRLAYLGRTMQASISEGFWQLLSLTRQYVPGEQIVQTYTRDGMPQVHKFKAEQSFKPGQRVRVTMGTSLASTRASRMEEGTKLWEMGLIRDPEQFSQFVELPTEQFTPAIAHDVRLARNENLTLTEEQAVTPNSWDNHAIHIREHNNFRKTQEYLTASNEVKRRFEHHVQEHKRLEIETIKDEVEKQQLIAMAQAPPQGAATPQQEGPPQGEAPQQESPQ